MKIREVAREHDIYIVPAPPLARSLYTIRLNLSKRSQMVYLPLLLKSWRMYSSLSNTAEKGGQRPNLKTSELPIPPDLRQ